MAAGVVAATFFGLTALTALTAGAQEGPTPEQQAATATENRQAVFKLLGVNMGPIVGMARGAVPFDAALAERNARRIAMLAPMIPERFSAMDTREFDVETEALPVIWDDMDDFSAKAAALVEQANAFAETAAGGDQAATLGGLRNLGGACGNCHDAYRVDDD
jgi:cytochrome c556